eukprot:105548-Ditylum_brightwellii.AAC.1
MSLALKQTDVARAGNIIKSTALAYQRKMPTSAWMYWAVSGGTRGASSDSGTSWPSWPYHILTWRWGECS